MDWLRIRASDSVLSEPWVCVCVCARVGLINNVGLSHNWGTYAKTRFFSPIAERFGVFAQIGAQVVRGGLGGSEVGFQRGFWGLEGSTGGWFTGRRVWGVARRVSGLHGVALSNSAVLSVVSRCRQPMLATKQIYPNLQGRVFPVLLLEVESSTGRGGYPLFFTVVLGNQCRQ